MIKKITLNQIASYKNETSLETDKKVNLIYGLNGTGKTTIANYLYNPNDTAFSGCSIEGFNDEELLVYSQQFIQDYFYQPDNLKGIFTLSKENKEAIEKVENADKEISKFKEEKEDKNSEKEKNENDFKSKAEAAEKKVWEIKTKYAGDDRVLGYCLTGSVGSKKTLFEKLSHIEKPKTKPFETIERLEIEVRAIEGDTAKKYDLLPEIKLSMQDIENNNLFQKQIVGNENSSISTLINQLKNSDWIKAGIEYLSKSSGKCPFCQRDISDDIVNDIKNFFDKAYENDINQLKDLQSTYTTKVKTIPAKNLYENNPFISENKNKFENLYSALANCLNANQAEIEKKLSTPSQSITLRGSSDAIKNFNTFIIEINQKISEHNQKFDNKESTLKDIETKFWKIMRFDYDQTISAYLSEKDNNDKTIAKLS
ncbi:MAG: AAA family ATPase, partial [Endomicrobium sp.]|nr:AAA family ATPase [Endomicrobium sp.]